MTLHKGSAAASNHTAALPQRSAESKRSTGDQVAVEACRTRLSPAMQCTICFGHMILWHIPFSTCDSSCCWQCVLQIAQNVAQTAQAMNHSISFKIMQHRHFNQQVQGNWRKQGSRQMKQCKDVLVPTCRPMAALPEGLQTSLLGCDGRFQCSETAQCSKRSAACMDGCTYLSHLTLSVQLESICSID